MPKVKCEDLTPDLYKLLILKDDALFHQCLRIDATCPGTPFPFRRQVLTAQLLQRGNTTFRDPATISLPPGNGMFDVPLIEFRGRRVLNQPVGSCRFAQQPGRSRHETAWSACGSPGWVRSLSKHRLANGALCLMNDRSLIPSLAGTNTKLGHYRKRGRGCVPVSYPLTFWFLGLSLDAPSSILDRNCDGSMDGYRANVVT